MFERFTDGARAVVVDALERARDEDAVTAAMRHGPWRVSGSHRVAEMGGDAGDTNRALLQRASSPTAAGEDVHWPGVQRGDQPVQIVRMLVGVDSEASSVRLLRSAPRGS
jgi:hypothetical protein